MTTVALVPARANSKRLPGKALRELGSRPMICWTIDAALASGCFRMIAVCSDDPAVLDLAMTRYERLTVFKREPVSDSQPDIEWIREIYGPGWDGTFDTFSILRATSPFRDAATIRRAFARWDQVKDQVDSLRAVRKVSEHPGKMWVVGSDYMDPVAVELWPSAWANNDSPFPQPWNRPTQALGNYYVQTAGIEISWTRNLPGSISGERVAPFVVEGPAGLDVNEPEDFAVAEWYVREGLA